MGAFGGFYGRVYEQVPGRCLNCNRDVALGRRDTRLLWPDLSDNMVSPQSEHVFEEVWQCMYCEKTITFLKHYNAAGERSDDEVPGMTVVWPRTPPRELDPSVPRAVASLFREASECENAGAFRGAAGLYRAAVEELCRDREAEGRDLFARIEDLGKRGLTQDIVANLHEARLLGNWSLDDGLEFAPEEVADVAELIDEACHILFVEPAERAALRTAREERRKDFRGRA